MEEEGLSGWEWKRERVVLQDALIRMGGMCGMGARPPRGGTAGSVNSKIRILTIGFIGIVGAICIQLSGAVFLAQTGDSTLCYIIWHGMQCRVKPGCFGLLFVMAFGSFSAC